MAAMAAPLLAAAATAMVSSGTRGGLPVTYFSRRDTHSMHGTASLSLMVNRPAQLAIESRLTAVEMLAKSKKPKRKVAKRQTASKSPSPSTAKAQSSAVPRSGASEDRSASVESPSSRQERLDQALRKAGIQPADPASTSRPPTSTDPLARIPLKGQLLLEQFFGGGALLFGGLFITSGIAVAVEAVCKVLGKPLPVAVDEVLVQYVEPLLTPSILILFFFSISLGLLKQLQLSSDTAGVLYREDDED